MESERLMSDYSLIKLESACLKTVSASRMTGIKDRHVVFFCHFVNCGEETCKVLLGINILLSVSREKDVLSLLKTKAKMDITCLNLSKVITKNLCHRRAGYVCTLLGQACVRKITTSVLGVCHVYVRDDVNNTAVSLLGKALILTSIARFHVEDRNMKSLGTDYRKARIGVTKNKHGIRLDCNHQLIGGGNNIAHCFAKICANCVEINLWIGEL